MTDNITYSFIAYDVAVTMDEDIIKRELMKNYEGVKQVTRVFTDDEYQRPKTSVQIDFKSYKDAKKIYRDRSIILGGISRRVRTIQRPIYQEYQRSYEEPYEEPYQNGQNTWEYTSEQTSEPELITEESLIDMFEQQKTCLREMLNSLENKLNYTITLNHTKNNISEWPVLSTNGSK